LLRKVLIASYGYGLAYSLRVLAMEKSLRIDKNETISVLKKLVSIKSVNPDIESGDGEIEVSNFIAEYLKKTGLEVHAQ
jgi:acetylornithine deacetylase/succinyl-diaminopimelate desuccinylase-like protein